MTAEKITNRELIIAAITIGLGTAVPLLFHGIKGAGPLFLPMFYPVVIAGFLICPRLAVLTGLLTPAVSTLITGMPPINPPVMFMMAIELAVLAGTISLLEQRFRLNPYLNVGLALLVDRVVYTGLLVLFARLFDLPVFSFALLKLFSGWPGLLVILIILPGLAHKLQEKFTEVDYYAT